MAKRSSKQAIMTKQSSAYRSDRINTQAIHRIDGSSKREVSRSSIPALRSWSIGQRFVTEAEKDAQAEKQMNPYGWSKRLNPICSSCYIQKALNGSCNCS
jgi:hypothetical protein